MTRSLFVGRGLALKPSLWTRGLSPSRRLLLASEPKAWSLGGRRVLAALRGAGFTAEAHLLPRGEAAKSWPAVSRLLEAMLRRGLGRDGALVALGGGAVTDAAGFAAAVYMRGIPWASLPTTLLGQVDAGLGGKTAIDLPQGKNLAGAFHMPRAVVCDTSFLDGLGRRERLCGLAEALKLGLAREPALWRWLKGHWLDLLAGEPRLTEALVRRAAAGKMRVAARDPLETKGERETLNFGHTLGHALEAAANFGPLRHGEAVILGMRAALRLSPVELPDVEEFLGSLPVPRVRFSRNRVLAALRRDKKVRNGRVRFVLLAGLGRPVIREIPEARVCKCLNEVRS
ncbi:MAG: 3-dehydroquinate synthase [Elusimicrobia bacterium]|nr:3-dehydroquinate synthase [Elusimicrobiota bacterium]